MTEYENDRTFAPPEHLAGLIAEYGTPLWVLDPGGLRRRYRELKDFFAWNPGYSQWLPLCRLRHTGLLRILAREGCGAVCESGSQLRLAQEAGFPPERILFAPLCPSWAEMALAAELGTQVGVDSPLVVDCMAEVGFVPQNVGLCLWMGPGKSEDSSPTLPGMDRCALLTQAARLAAMGVRELGLMAQGESCGQGALEQRVKRLLPIVEDVRALTGLTVSWLDVDGGGLLGQTPPQTPRSQSLWLRRILGPVPELNVRTRFDDWLVAPAALLLTGVVGVKEGGRTFVFLDAGPACFCGGTAQAGRHHVSKLGDRRVEDRNSYFLALCRPEGEQLPARRRVLPPLRKGDALVFHDMGLHLAEMDGGRAVMYSDDADDGAQDP